MTTGTVAPYRPAAAAGRESFWHLVHAELTKFRTVRGWVIAMVIAILVTTAVGLLGSDQHCEDSQSSAAGNRSSSVCPAPPTGPGGEPVQDAFYFAHQSLTGNGTITVQMTSLTGQSLLSQGPGTPTQAVPGLEPWSKAGIIIKESTSPGSAYAAMMVAGSHGVRMQWDFVNDTPGLAGSVSAASPRWLRLVRDGDTLTGYDSADGTRWTRVAAATLPGLTSTVQAGLFAASPFYGNLSLATGVFQNIRLSWPASGWTGTKVGSSPPGVNLSGTFSQSAGALSVTGSGDISPIAGNWNVVTVQNVLVGTFAGLIVLIVVGAMFITTEYRRRLIDISLTASPRRGRLLAAKAVALGAVTFVTGLIAAIASIAVGSRYLGKYGTPLSPVPALTEGRMAVGTAAMLAVAAVLALAIGTILRRSAAAVATVIVVIFIPYLFALLPTQLPLSAEQWLLRITPAAAFSVQQALPPYSQVAAQYTPNGGYYPLAPWAGFVVECAWAVAALALASYLLRRRDA